VLVPAALAAFFTSVAGLLSLIATGTSPVTINTCIAVLLIATTGSNPHFASVAANEKQNALVELENDFASLAIDLLKMYNKLLPLPIVVTVTQQGRACQVLLSRSGVAGLCSAHRSRAQGRGSARPSRQADRMDLDRTTEVGAPLAPPNFDGPTDCHRQGGQAVHLAQERVLPLDHDSMLSHRGAPPRDQATQGTLQGGELLQEAEYPHSYSLALSLSLSFSLSLFV
jgi:hypothetical protein